MDNIIYVALSIMVALVGGWFIREAVVEYKKGYYYLFGLDVFLAFYMALKMIQLIFEM